MNIRVTFGFHLPGETPDTVASTLSRIQLNPHLVTAIQVHSGVVIGPALVMETDPCPVTKRHLRTLGQLAGAFDVQGPPRWLWVEE